MPRATPGACSSSLITAMTSFRSRDTSLYELALSSEQPPHPLQVSPTTFKTMVANFIDLLIEYKIPATLWLKLPKGEAWQTELDRYRNFSTQPNSIYILHTHREEGSDRPEPDSLIVEPKPTEEALPLAFGSEASMSEGHGVATLEAENLTEMMLSLAPDSQLRREYFLLVLSDQFCGLVLAHRPRSVRPSKGDPDPFNHHTNNHKSSPEDDSERRHPLLGLNSFDPQTLQHILEGIRQAVHFGQLANPAPGVDELLLQWDRLSNQIATTPLNPTLIGHLFRGQIRCQEDVWHSSATYRKQAEAASASQQHNEELLNSIRMKDEFLKNVGQELRTPLATMKTALTLLNSPSLKPAQRQRYMDMLSRECDRQGSLITSVLDLLQLETEAEQTPMQPIRLMDVVPGVVSTYQPLAQEKGVMLAYTVPEELPAVACLSASLRQIVINLLHNGIKFTPKGGQVWVKAKQQGDYVQVEFRDTGTGIAPTDVPKIFDRFYRVRVSGEETSGVGLGLSIVQQLLLRCGGSISVKSKPGEGSIFNVLLPIYR